MGKIQDRPTPGQDSVAGPAGDGAGLALAPELVDAQGTIPSFPPRPIDEHGRLLPLTPEERDARRDAAIRALKAFRDLPDDDPPGAEQAMMRGIDENRPHRRLFEGMY
jgi:hypothetical protein